MFRLPLAALLCCAALPAAATTYAFDDEAALRSAFLIDAAPGASGTGWTAEWEPEDLSHWWNGPSGGSVTLDHRWSVNSLTFRDGPVVLESFSLAAEMLLPSCSVTGGPQLEVSVLDSAGALLLQQVASARADGGWSTVDLNVAGAALISFAPRDLYDIRYWRLKIDDVAVSAWDAPSAELILAQEALAAAQNPPAVPLPATAPLAAAGIAAMGWVSRRARRRAD